MKFNCFMLLIFTVLCARSANNYVAYDNLPADKIAYQLEIANFEQNYDEKLKEIAHNCSHINERDSEGRKPIFFALVNMFCPFSLLTLMVEKYGAQIHDIIGNKNALDLLETRDEWVGRLDERIKRNHKLKKQFIAQKINPKSS